MPTFASRFRCVQLAAFATLAWPTVVCANDGYGELGLGGLVTLGKTYAVAMRTEVLEVSEDRIRVDYVFEKAGAYDTRRNASIPVLFPLPLYSADTPSHSWAGAPRNFSVKINGQAAPFKTIVKARSAKSCFPDESDRRCALDVTGTLRAVGLTDAQIAHFPHESPFAHAENPKQPHPLTEAQQAQLLREGLLDTEWLGPEVHYPMWLADVTYQWDMRFGDAKAIQVSHEYTPFTSGGSNSYSFTEDLLRNDYCADDVLIAKWQQLVASSTGWEGSYGPVMGRRVEYILTTANSWAGPIADFTLRLKKQKPSEVVMLCFPGKPRQVDPLTLEVRLSNFEPKAELRVLFLNVDSRDWPSGDAPEIRN